MITQSSLDRAEIEKFQKHSSLWWDERGPFAPLHKINPVRMTYIRDVLCDCFSRDAQQLPPLKDLNHLDVGCGGGLVAEPLARLGLNITAIDGDSQAINAAKAHQGSLVVNYRHCLAEQLVDEGVQFDSITALEIIEHVSDPLFFVKTLSKLLKPGGCLILSTLNKTKKSYLLGIMMAEYVLRLVPQGTHDWNKFISPDDLKSIVESSGLDFNGFKGMSFSLLNQKWQLGDDLSVNYFCVASKKA